MRKIATQREFVLEREFKSILNDLILISENFKAGDTVNWDMPTKDIKAPEFEWDMPLKDESPIEMEWDIKVKPTFKDYISKIKSNWNRFEDYLREDDPEVVFNDIPKGKMIKFLSKLNKEEIKNYFKKFITELKNLPYEIKKGMITKLVLIFIGFITLNDLIPSNETEPILNDIKTEISKETNKKQKVDLNLDEVEKEDSISKFEIAQKLVSLAEGQFTDDPHDDGNWTGGEEGKGILIGTNHGISAPTLVDYFKNTGIDRMPTMTDMRNLKYETALDIYKKNYWDRQGFYKIKDQNISNVLYDACVNQGENATLRIFNNSIELLSKNIKTLKGYRFDNWSDFKSSDAISILNELSIKDMQSFFEIIKNKRLEEYKTARRWKRYKRSWTSRLDALTYDKTYDNVLGNDIA